MLDTDQTCLCWRFVFYLLANVLRFVDQLAESDALRNVVCVRRINSTRFRDDQQQQVREVIANSARASRIQQFLAQQLQGLVHKCLRHIGLEME